MATTSLIPIKHVQALQAQKEVTLNAALDNLVKAAYEHATVSLSAASTILDALDIWNAGVLVFASTPASSIVDFPVEVALSGESAVTIQKIWTVVNDSGSTIGMRTVGGSSIVEVLDGESTIIRHDGEELYQITPTSNPNANKAFRVALFKEGKPADGSTWLRLPFDTSVTFPAGLGTSASTAGTGSTGSAAFSLRKNGVEFGTATFASAAVATFAAASDTTFTAGTDVLTVIAPSPQNSTLSNVSLLLRGTYA